MQLPHQTPDSFPHSLSGVSISPSELARRLDDGTRCVRYEYCVSVIVATIRYQSHVHLSDSWEARVLYGIPYSLLAVVLGPWGLPWGPIQVVRACWVNLCGGVDVTTDIEHWLDQRVPIPAMPPVRPTPPAPDDE